MTPLPNFSYDREATVIAGTTKIPVRAELRKHFSQQSGEEWHGTVTALDPTEDFWAVTDAGGAVLRTDTGEASFRPDDRFTHVHGTIATMPSTGNGRAPF